MITIRVTGTTRLGHRPCSLKNFVQITGPLTFTPALRNRECRISLSFSNEWVGIVAPNYVMQHDLSLWNQSSNGYTLPYPTPAGNTTSKINEYLYDEVATCATGATPSGCGYTYLDTSYNGSSQDRTYTIQERGAIHQQHCC